jgi:hypothetical protein
MLKLFNESDYDRLMDQRVLKNSQRPSTGPPDTKCEPTSYQLADSQRDEEIRNLDNCNGNPKQVEELARGVRREPR